MSSDSPIEDAKGAMQVVGDLLKAAGDDPSAKKAAANLGKAAVTVTATINTVLLPFAAINFGVEKARKYFQDKFAADLSEKTSDIPPTNLVEPKASVVGQAVQALAFSHDEPDLKSLYISLIAASMDGRKAASAHPSFVEVIKQLSGEEARLLKTLPPGVFSSGNNVPVANVLLHAAGAIGIQHAYRHLQPLTLLGTSVPASHKDATVAAENWIRLGLVEIRYDLEILVPGAYDWLESRPEVLQLRQRHPAPDNTITFERGILRATEFGSRFAATVGIS